MKKFSEVAKHYIGCMIEVQEDHVLPIKKIAVHRKGARFHLDEYTLIMMREKIPLKVKPILRRLESMTKEEALHVAWLIMDSKLLDEDSKVTKEEISIDIISPDGGNCVDEYALMIIDIECRCFIGHLAVYPMGDMILFDEDTDKICGIENHIAVIDFLYSMHMDLHGLIDSGEAIDRATVNNQ